MSVYITGAGESIFDVCLFCYMSLDYLYKMIQDNYIDSINTPIVAGMTIYYDATLCANLQLQQQNILNGINYSTI